MGKIDKQIIIKPARNSVTNYFYVNRLKGKAYGRIRSYLDKNKRKNHKIFTIEYRETIIQRFQ